MGTFFVIPVYLQVVLGFDAFETGKRLLPLSVAMLVFALLGPRIAARRSPRTVAQLGLVAVSIGAIVMLATLDVKLNDTGFKIALAIIGAGGGLLASQLGNVIMSSVAPAQDQRGGRPPGHRPEPRLLARHGDHRRGAARVARDGLQPAHRRQPRRSGGRARDDRRERRAGDRHRARRRTSRRRRSKAGLTQDQAQAVAADYGDAQLDALRLALGAVAARGAAVAVVHAPTADPLTRGRSCEGAQVSTTR